MKTLIRGTLALCFASAAIVASATTAAAATPTPGSLDTGSKLFALDCDGTNGQLYSVDTSNADGTPIGTGNGFGTSDCAGGAAWDASTGASYYIAYGDPAGGVDASPSYLVEINVSTGVSTNIGALELGNVLEDVTAIAIEPGGAAYAVDTSGELYSLSLSTGALTNIGATGSTDLFGFAADPVTGTLYVLNYDTNDYSTVNPTTADLTYVNTTDLNGGDGDSPEALQIDENGTFWVENDEGDRNSLAGIWSFDPADPADTSHSGDFTVDDGPTYTESLLLIPGVAPVITSAAPPASVTLGTPISYAVSATGTAAITFSITSGALPTGLSLDPTTGVISGTPTAVGSFTYTITATNSVGATDQVVTETVAAAIHLPIVSG